MLFLIIRFIILIIVTAFTILKIKTSKIIKKRLFSLFLIIIYVVTLSVSAMFPTENLFIAFKSPESLFNYASTGKIDNIIPGKDSCMVIYSRGNNSGGYYIIPKIKNEYKIPNYFTTKKVSDKFDESGIFKVYNVKGTQDYYVFGILHFEDGENQIRILNEKNEKVESDIIRVKSTNFVYFYLEEFPNGYHILINNKKISLS